MDGQMNATVGPHYDKEDSKEDRPNTVVTGCVVYALLMTTNTAYLFRSSVHPKSLHSHFLHHRQNILEYTGLC